MRRAIVLRTVPAPGGGAQPWVVVSLDGGASALAPLEAVDELAATLQPGDRVLIADVGTIRDAELVVVALLPRP